MKPEESSWISGYLDDELDATERQEAEQVLSSSDEHQKTLHSYVQVRDLLSSLPRLQTPAHILQKLADLPKRSPITRLWDGDPETDSITHADVYADANTIPGIESLPSATGTSVPRILNFLEAKRLSRIACWAAAAILLVSTGLVLRHQAHLSPMLSSPANLAANGNNLAENANPIDIVNGTTPSHPDLPATASATVGVGEIQGASAEATESSSTHVASRDLAGSEAPSQGLVHRARAQTLIDGLLNTGVLRSLIVHTNEPAVAEAQKRLRTLVNHAALSSPHHILIVPHHLADNQENTEHLPKDAVVYLLDMNEAEYDRFLKQLRQQFPDQVEVNATIAPSVVMDLSASRDAETLGITPATVLRSPDGKIHRLHAQSSPEGLPADTTTEIVVPHGGQDPLLDRLRIAPEVTPADPDAQAAVTEPAPAKPAVNAAKPSETHPHSGHFTVLIWLGR